MALITTDKLRVVIGLGVTGLSCARYYRSKGLPFVMWDTRPNAPGAASFAKEYPDTELILGPLDPQRLAQASELVVSPGVSIRQPAIEQALSAGVSVVGDIELFCREVTAPIIAITGSNAKSTVTTLVGEMASAAGIRVCVGGNIGTPVLDTLAEGEAELYVLELSSFQLETTHTLQADVATVLNVTPDHMDRYNGFPDYHRTKHRIYRGAKTVVANAEDMLTQPLLASGQTLIQYRMGAPDLREFGLLMIDGEPWLAQGQSPISALSQLKIAGKHNQQNALVAAALACAAGIPSEAIRNTLRSFTGLPHRCEWVAEKKGVRFYNDSKGTNTGATLAAVEGLGESLEGRRIVLIAGGVGKGADFGVLSAAFGHYLKALVLIGDDASKIASQTRYDQPHFSPSLEDAVRLSAQLAESGDVVLLSPACASFDMFANFEKRGEAFIAAVGSL